LQESRFKEDPIAPHLLLLGETGTGKSLLARWLHRMRFEKVRDKKEERVQALFQDLNCGGLSPKLIDSELFGGVAGAWTSLTNNTPGKIFCACQGTLFLDEIGELPLSTQAVLLKFLDDGEYYPVGGHGEKLYIPTTVIAATNQPVEQLIAQGKFRRDLYERFRFRIRLPSLRERMDHFDHLVDFVLQNPSVNRETDGRRDVQAVSVRALDRLRRHPWPGNFRELEQVLWRAVSHARQEEKKTILPHHIVFDPGDFMV
jgi:transcriptional regulator with PAS, ATPase and Fis domain